MNTFEQRKKAHGLHTKLNDSVKVLGSQYVTRRHHIEVHPDRLDAIHSDLARQIGTGLATNGFVDFGKHTFEKDQYWHARESPFDEVAVTAQVVVMSYADYVEIMRLSNELSR